MKLYQQTVKLRKRERGFHLITSDVLQAVPWLKEINMGVCQIFIQHTSASLAINENADPTVRMDFENWFNNVVPEDDINYLHNEEGLDDMPAHIKAALLGNSVTIPIRDGRLAVGMWQGIYLCEHRDNGTPRNIIITAWGT